MKIAYKHLLNFLVDKPSIEELSIKLFQLGHEHEIDGSIFDMEFTPNRGDCLSLLGIARDLNVFYATKLDVEIYDKDIAELDLNFINEEKDKCPYISFLNIEVINQTSDYKDYLNNYFIDLNLNKNNFFTDISNYIAYEMGQPTHSYDYSLIDSDITLKENHTHTEFKTLLGNNIDLTGSDLVFINKNKIINLSGVMGGINTACNKHTSKALIECAYFKPEAIIGKSLKYNLHSEASHKFERGTDPNCHEKILRRFIKIVGDHSDIVKLELYSNSKNNFSNIELDFNLNKVNSILGLDVDKRVYEDSLIKLGFSVNSRITVPSYRHDISHQNDLAEELARVIGYDNIPVKSINLEHLTKKVQFSNEDKLKTFLVNNGFNEVINSSFCSLKTKDSIKVDNPLDSNRKFIRTSIVNSLIDNLIYNEKRQKDSIKLFEISNVYTSNENFQNDKRLALIISGKKGENHIDFAQKLDKKYLKDMFGEVGINIEEYFVDIDRQKINSKIKTPIYALEISISELDQDLIKDKPEPRTLSNFTQYKRISEFPSSYRDLSFSVQDISMVSETITKLSAIESDIIKKSFMFDFYQNKNIDESKIGFRFIFQSNNKTLTDTEIDDEIKKIIDQALLIKSVNLPGIS